MMTRLYVWRTSYATQSATHYNTLQRKLQYTADICVCDIFCTCDFTRLCVYLGPETCMRHDSFSWDTSHSYDALCTCDATRLCVRQGLFISAHWHAWGTSFTRVQYFIHMRGISRSFVWHASFVGSRIFHLWRCRALGLRHTALLRTYWHAMCDVVNSHVWRAAFTSVTCLIHLCKMPHSYRDIVNVDSTVPAFLNDISTLFLPQRVECLSTHICSYSALLYYRNRLFETVVLSLGHSWVIFRNWAR